MLYIQPITALLTTAPAAGSLLIPTLATDGVDISVWRKGVTPINYDAATVYLTATAAATLGDATHPIYLCGYRNSTWWLAGLLDGGNTIVFPASGLNVARRIGDVGIFTRLAVYCGALGGTTYTYQFEPIAQHVST